MSEPRRAVVVDDERLARLELCSLLAQDPSVVVVGEAASVVDAQAIIEREQPDLVFLDIQLGDETGFTLLERTQVSGEIIFVTAYDEHAVRAFEVNAADYLLKPVHPDRLRDTLRRLDDGPADRPPETLLDAEDRLFVRVNERWRFLKVATIWSIEAAGDYTRVRTADGEAVLLHKSLQEWESRLPNKQFTRIHRSTIVNLDAVERVEEWSRHTFRVYVKGFTEPYPMSRRYAARLRQ